MTTRLLALAALLAGGCGTVHPPVPVATEGGVGTSLAGVWEGTYESRDTGRVGTLTFALSAAGDSAVGEVVMVPRGMPVVVHQEDGRWRWEGVARSEVLTIRFVRLRPGAVVGELDPYRDPDCGCELRTTFRGTVEGDTALGTFASAASHASHDAEGTWHAVRRRE